MEIKALNLEIITLFEKISKSLDAKSNNLNERVDILDQKIDHIIMLLDEFKIRSEYLKHLGEHPLFKKNKH